MQPPYTLRSATLEDLRAALAWVSTPELLRLWGGAALTFPPEAAMTWREILADGENTFALVDAQGSLAGFGQIFLHPPETVHLGRIIVSPELRGQGVGRILCLELIEAGRARFHPAAFTLNVYTTNTPALKLYISLGFTVMSENPAQNAVKMRLLEDKSA